MTAAAEQEYYTKARTQVTAILESITALEGMAKTWNALDYGTNLDVGTGIHDGLTKSHIGAAVMTTVPAIRSLFDSGHATNFEAIRY